MGVWAVIRAESGSDESKGVSCGRWELVKGRERRETSLGENVTGWGDGI